MNTNTIMDADYEVIRMVRRGQNGKPRQIGYVVSTEEAAQLLQLKHRAKNRPFRIMAIILYFCLFLAGAFQGLVNPYFAGLLVSLPLAAIIFTDGFRRKVRKVLK